MVKRCPLAGVGPSANRPDPVPRTSKPAFNLSILKPQRSQKYTCGLPFRHHVLNMASQVDPPGSTPPKYLKRPYKLLREGADATITDAEGNGAFHYLVKSDMFEPPGSPGEESLLSLLGRPPSPVDDPSMTMEELIQRLQAAGAQINLQNKKGETPLHSMCRRAHSHYGKLDERLLECLCLAGADLNIKDYQGRSAAFFLFVTSPLDDRQKDGGEHLCQLISRLGGRFDTRDDHGRTVLHCLLSSRDGAHVSLVETLARHGVDPAAVDDEGNTLWHAAVDSLDQCGGGNKQLSDLLLRLGADPQKPNKMGRNPLHALSSRYAPVLGWRSLVFPACIPDVRTTAFDRMLQIYVTAGYDLGCRDNHGITPLHLACTFSEYQAKRLLEAGADPSIPTDEGLTTLHHAARCRQANIIGLLLDKIKQDGCNLDIRSSTASHQLAVNAKDVHGKSALHYACASGRAESVALLLDAGASVHCDAYSGSVWEACAGFEKEQSNWERCPPVPSGRMTASSVLLEDMRRPVRETEHKLPREHLGDVVRLLLLHQDAPEATRSYLDEAISAAAAKELHYTVWCLVEARKSLDLSSGPGAAEFTPDRAVSACLDRFAAQGIDEAATLSPQALRAEFERLMGLRRLDLVQKLLLEHGWGEVGWIRSTLIHDLVRNGLVSVLRDLTPLVKDLSAKLEDIEWCARQKPASAPASKRPSLVGSHPKSCAQPLLVVACRSEEPNMEMVKFLVEEIGCGVDTQGYVRIGIPDSSTRYGLCKDDTPIHALVRGGRNWWHTSQALPYLVRDQGANLEIRDGLQSTPLAVAVSHAGRVTFSQTAVDALLELGADAKAVDLTLACVSAEVTRLLLSKGARVRPANILAAIRSLNCEFLDILLSGGGDVNASETLIPEAHQRRSTPVYVEAAAPPREFGLVVDEFVKRLSGIPVRPSRDKQTDATPGPFVPEEQMYPLDYAAHLYARQPELDKMLQLMSVSNDYGDNIPYMSELPADELEKVIETLVARGADVMATYTFPDGSSMSIKDRIVLRGRDYNTGRRKLERPRRARRILELCKTTYEGEL